MVLLKEHGVQNREFLPQCGLPLRLFHRKEIGEGRDILIEMMSWESGSKQMCANLNFIVPGGDSAELMWYINW